MGASDVQTASLAVSAAWCRHRGNFRRDNEDTVLVHGFEGSAVVAGDAGAVQLSSGGRGCLAVVCDGVGGEAAGEVASVLAACAFADKLSQRVAAAPPSVESESAHCMWVGEAVREAHNRVVAEASIDRRLEGMGTTLTAAWVQGSSLYCAQVGDSRLYRLRAGRFEQVSKDQSFVGRLRQQGELTEQQARRHAMRNLVDQVVGGGVGDVHPEVRAHRVADGDEWLLCSDGLNDALSDRLIERELVRGLDRPAEQVVQSLLELVLETAGRDNVSVLLLRIGRSRASAVSAFLARLRHRIRNWRASRARPHPASLELDGSGR